ncbi:MAG: hypothetical protein VZR00_04110 [Lachnospiraceae bacterium]|jgi:HEPN domain-containing protein|nr:hypothetical protein [Lachnospiraceae bacterium]MEE3461063.1 hypothetical protein [Lachnospiraceae bacterium]
MEVYEFYEALGENYSAVLKRIPDKEAILDMLKEYRDIDHFDELKNALDVSDYEKALLHAGALAELSLNAGLSETAKEANCVRDAIENVSKNSDDEIMKQVLAKAFKKLDSSYVKADFMLDGL